MKAYKATSDGGQRQVKLSYNKAKGTLFVPAIFMKERIQNMYQAEPKRYETMTYERCGGSGLKLPRVSLGFWHNFGDTGCYQNMKAMCRTAFDNGITHFDLANNYGPPDGTAEINAGRIFREDFRPYRDELIISSKAGYFMWNGPYGDGGSRKYLIASLDQSLRRLGLDYVDIFYHHRMDPETPLEETMGALADIVKSGKALYAGISNYDGATSKRAMAIMKDLGVPLILNQSRYSIFDRRAETEGLTELNQSDTLSLISYSPLAQGLLTDRYLHGIPEDSRVKTDGRFLKEGQITETLLEKIRALNEMARERGQSLAAMALAWVLADKKSLSVLVGASSPAQILENLKALENRHFTAEELKRIDEISLR